MTERAHTARPAPAWTPLSDSCSKTTGENGPQVGPGDSEVGDSISHAPKCAVVIQSLTARCSYVAHNPEGVAS